MFLPAERGHSPLPQDQRFDLFSNHSHLLVACFSMQRITQRCAVLQPEITELVTNSGILLFCR